MANDDEISINLGKITGFFKRKKKDKIEAEKEKIKELKAEETTLKKKEALIKKEELTIKAEEKAVQKEIKEEQKKIHTLTKSEDDEEISLDFSKIKGFFKGLTGKGKHTSHKASEDEVSVDFSKAKKFLIKYQIPLLLVLVIVLQLIPNDGYLPWGGIWMRMQNQDIPQADDWAQNAVHNFFKNQIQQAVNKEYPNLPDDKKNKIINEEFDKLLKDQKAVIDQQTELMAKQLRGNFQYEYEGETYTYMPDIDPYTYLRYARNLEEKGHGYDELKDGEPWNTHMVAPLGNPMPFSFHGYLLYYIYKFMSFFSSKIDLMYAATYFPIIFVFLSLIPAFFIGRRFAGNVGGFFTAMMVALCTAGFGRTPWGHADTDAYQVFFPLLITWLFVEAFAFKDKKKRYGLLALTGFATAVYSQAWGGGWWYVFDFLLATIGIFFVYQVYIYRKEVLKNILNVFRTPALKDTILVGLVFFIVTGIFVSIFSSFNIFIDAIRAPLGFTIIKAAAHKTLWPNVYTTVAELNPASVKTVIQALGGNFLFAIAVLGIVLMLLKKDEYGKYDLKYSALLTIWFIGTIYAATKGTRFTLLLAPAFSVAFGAALGIVYEKVTNWLEKEINIQKFISGTVLIILFGLLFISPAKADMSQTKADLPLINDAWWNALTAIKEKAEPDAIINSWWDFGHHFKYIADRAVTFDGASQNTPMAHWIGHVLLTDNEDEAVGILRMLDCGSNTAFEKINEELDDPHKTIDLLYKIIVLDKKEAAEVLEEAGIEKVDDILDLTHCSPPDNYFIASDDMISKSGVWGHFGAWNFERADIWINLRNLPKDQMIEVLEKKHGYDKDTAEKTYYDVQAISKEDEANTWIAPWPGYATGLAGCTQAKKEITCGNGLTVNLDAETAKITAQDGEGIPQAIVYIDDNKNFTEIKIKGANVGVSAILIPVENGYQSLFADPLTAKSMFTRLYFFDGHGLKHFELFDEQTQIIGGKIFTWKVDWEGGEPRVHRNLIEKTTVSKGDKISVDYIGYLDNGTVFDSSIKDWRQQNITKNNKFSDYETNPLSFEVGAGQMIKGFDAAVVGMEKGEEKKVKIDPEDAYGTDPEKHPLGNQTLNFKIRVEIIK